MKDEGAKNAPAQHLLRLTRQILQTQPGLDDDMISEWAPVVARLAVTAVLSLRGGKGGQRFVVRAKVKRVVGSTATSSSFVSGFVFRAQLVHRVFAATRVEPRVILFSFALEFAGANKLVTLESLLAHERDYLRLLVGRILSLRPDVLLVGGSVARMAQDLLVDANVATITNVKLHVLDAIANCSGAKVVQSFDQLVDSCVGYFDCYSVRLFDDPLILGTRKSLVFLEGCSKENVGTIILRGASLECLTAIKNVMNTVVYVAHNIFAEQCFLEDERAVLVNPPAQTISSQQRLDGGTTRLEMALHKYESACLSASPYVKFPPPYILVRLHALKSLPSSDTASTNSSSAAHDQLVTSLESNSTPYFEKLDELSPLLYQKIVFLFSSICLDTGIPCQPAELHVIEYYSETDISIGMYIQELCSNCTSICPTKGCGLSMIRHFRSYAHGQGRINIIVEQLEISSQEGIQMWTYCNHCKARTPTATLSPESWNYSFGKFLELVFYMQPTIPADLPYCNHDIHRDHIRFFAYKKFVVRFEFEPLELLEVSVPTMKVQTSLEVCLRLKSHDYESRRNQIIKFYDSVVSRIKHFSQEILPPQDKKTLLFKDFSNGLSKRASSEKKAMLQQLQHLFTQSSDMDSLALNAVLHSLYENVGKWENDFSMLARSFFTVDVTASSKVKENLSRRMIAVGSIHLRDMFSDHTTAAVAPTLLLPAHLKEDGGGQEVAWIPLGSSPVKQFQELMEELDDVVEESKRVRNKDRDGVRLLRGFPLIDEGYAGDSLDFSKLVSDGGGGGDTGGSQTNQDDPFDFLPFVATSASSLLGPEPDVLETINSPNSTVGTPHNPTTTSATGSTTIAAALSSTPPPLPPTFSMAARWRLETMEDEEQQESGSGTNGAFTDRRRSNNIVSISLSNNELEEEEEEAVPAGYGVFSNPVPIPSGERASILKTISALWTGSVASLPALEYPLQLSDHLFRDSLVIVREDEPSSIIAFTLSSNKYINKLKQWQLHPSTESITDNGNDDGLGSEAPASQSVGGGGGGGSSSGAGGGADIEEKLTSGKGHHIKFEFWDGTTKLDCKVFYAEQFDALRRNCGFEDGFVHSLSRCIKWDALGGKSGSAFLKTRDDRLILKQLSRQEMEALLKFAPFYFTYISEAFFHKLPTVLAKLFGFYRIAYKNPATNKSLKMDVLVMENLFFERHVSRIFDLKGSMRNRHVQSTGKQNQVLLDENLLEYLCESPIFIREYSKRILRASVWNDTLFLSKMDVMDYSLLVGIDEEKKELVVGIVGE
ncbi:UNVERIFIED_CONTAM: 1-phosphatidylinositol-3-phosphate 5-kinase [Siphonaria sp. JEL0065]|nr:1-phosphatidylinositol-3-phosphate 5-kinase [Siphonaria sp. JEL0065]